VNFQRLEDQIIIGYDEPLTKNEGKSQRGGQKRRRIKGRKEEEKSQGEKGRGKELGEAGRGKM
jgi:hypothetical protein